MRFLFSLSNAIFLILNLAMIVLATPHVSAAPVAAKPAVAPTPNANSAVAPAPAPAPGTSITTTTNNMDAPILQGLSLEGVIEDFEYSPEGRRDPFDPYTGGDTKLKDEGTVKTPLQKYDLDQLVLVAILWNIKHPKAFLKDPTGASYTVGLQDKVGRLNGSITEIREGEVVVRETFRVGDKTNEQMRVMKMNRKDKDTQ